MRRTIALILGAALLFGGASSYAYDWQPQANEELRSDMIAFAGEFASRQKGTSEGRKLRRFVRRQKRLAGKSPYAWISQTKDFVLKMEKRHSPTLDNSSKEALFRRDMFLLLDFPLHADNRSASAPEELICEFEQTSLSYRGQARLRALSALEEAGPAKPGELQVIKIYNCGVILRTSELCIAVDIKWEGGKAAASLIAQKADVFFLSHPHDDHYSTDMINALAAAGKPSVLPSDVVPETRWEGKRVASEEDGSFSVCGIGVDIVSGAQSGIPNNAYILSFDGWRVLLPGENSNTALYEGLCKYAAPNLIISPSWNRFTQILSYVEKMEGYNAAGVTFIPEHENELYHTVQHRESYRELFSREDRLGNKATTYPKVFLMDIGESLILSH